MNSNRVINLPEPVADHEPFRKGDLPIVEATLQILVDEAAAQADRAEQEANNAEGSAASALASELSAAESAEIAQQYPEGLLAAALADSDSDVLLAGQEARVVSFSTNSIAELLALPNTREGLTVYVESYYGDSSGIGSGGFVYSETEDKQNHNGVDVFDPDNILTIGSAAWYLPQNTGTGCWKRKGVGTEVTASMAGFLPGTNKHNLIRNIWTTSNLTKWSKFTFDISGLYQFNKSIGDSRIHTMTNVSDVTFVINQGANLRIDADITTSFNDGFRFDNANNVHWRGGGSLVCHNVGSPVIRRESCLVLFNGGSTNCSISELTLGTFLSADMPFGALYGARWSGETFFPSAYSLKFLSGTQGRSIQFGSCFGHSAYNNIWYGLGNTYEERNRSYGIRQLGAAIPCIAGTVRDNKIVIAQNARAVTALGIEGGANQVGSNPTKSINIHDNEVIMLSSDLFDTYNRSVYAISAIDVKESIITDNTVILPANRDSRNDQLYGVYVQKTDVDSEAFVENLIITGNKIQARWVYYIQEAVAGRIRSLTIHNEVLGFVPSTGQVFNNATLNSTFKMNGNGPLSVSSGLINSGAIFESGSNANGSWIKYANGVMETWRTFSVTVAAGNNDFNVPQPQPFVGSNNITTVNWGTADLNLISEIGTASSNTNYVFRVVATGAAARTISMRSIGRWYA